MVSDRFITATGAGIDGDRRQVVAVPAATPERPSLQWRVLPAVFCKPDNRQHDSDFFI